MRGTERPAASLVYVVGEFPSISETFVLREMTALEELGFRIIPLAIQRPRYGPIHAEAADLAGRAIYRPPPFSALTWLGLLRAGLQRPLGLFSATTLVLRHAVLFPRQIRELVSAYLTAAYFASRLPARGARHVHCHFSSYPTTVGLLLTEIRGCGFSFSCHARDIFVEASPLLSRKLRDADFVTVCTRYGLERLQRQHSLTTRDKLHLIRHGVDGDRLSRQARVQYPVPLLLAVGRLVEKKGYPFLLQAAAVLAGRGLHFELVIVGEGPQREELERLAGGLGLRDKVVFAGALSQEELGHVYRRAEALGVPSIVAADGDRDGLPNVILEAMAYGVPVVASNLPGIAEAVQHEVTGLLVSPGSPTELAAALERVVTDQALRAELVRNARSRLADEFDLLKNAVRLGALFASCLELRHWPPAATEPTAGDRG